MKRNQTKGKGDRRSPCMYGNTRYGEEYLSWRRRKNEHGNKEILLHIDKCESMVGPRGRGFPESSVREGPAAAHAPLDLDPPPVRP